MVHVIYSLPGVPGVYTHCYTTSVGGMLNTGRPCAQIDWFCGKDKDLFQHGRDNFVQRHHSYIGLFQTRFECWMVASNNIRVLKTNNTTRTTQPHQGLVVFFPLDTAVSLHTSKLPCPTPVQFLRVRLENKVVALNAWSSWDHKKTLTKQFSSAISWLAPWWLKGCPEWLGEGNRWLRV